MNLKSGRRKNSLLCAKESRLSGSGHGIIIFVRRSASQRRSSGYYRIYDVYLEVLI